MSNGLFIGRFQPFHNQHKEVIKQALQHDINQLILGIGSANRGMSLKNPFSVNERIDIIKRNTSDIIGVNFFIPIDDYYSSHRWNIEFHKICKAYNISKLFYHDKKDGSSDWVKHIPKSLNIEKIHLNSQNNISSTKIRYNNFLLRRIVGKELSDTYAKYKSFIEDYRKQFSNPYVSKPTFYTVDLILQVDDRILLIKRKGNVGAGSYALIGGFVDDGEEAFDSIIRETKEEVDITLSKRYFRDENYKFFDQPSRGDRGRIITKCYHYRINYSDKLHDNLVNFKSNSEVDEIVLIDKNQFLEYKRKMFADHALIISDMLGW